MNSTGQVPPLPKKVRRYFSLLCLLAAVTAAAFAFSGPLQAQERAEYEYVDLIMTYEYDNNFVAYRVQNSGTATATGVTISFLLEDLQAGTFAGTPPTTTKEGTNQEFIWEAGTVPPGETSRNFKFTTRNHSGHSTWNRIGVITATASSNQPEPDILLGNNVAKVYSYASSNTGSTKHMSDNRLALLLSVSDLRPDAGGNVNFDLTARNLNTDRGASSNYIDLISDLEIKVELSDGLKYKQSWTPSADDKFTIVPGKQSATWTPQAVDTMADPNIHATFPKSRKVTIQTQLTSDSLERIPREERCITAWVEDSIPPPNTDYVFGSLRQCLGDDPPVLFTKGSIGMLVPFPCIGVVNHVCRDEDGDNVSDSGVVVAAAAPLQDETVNLDAADTVNSDLRSQNIVPKHSFRSISDAAFLRPDNVIVQVKDPEGRINDTQSSSLITSGPSWQTGRKSSAISVPGVLVTYTKERHSPVNPDGPGLIKRCP